MDISKREVVARDYTVPLSDEELLAIIEMDMGDGVPLYEQLDRITGIDSVDYSGHFASFVYLKIDAKYDNHDLWVMVEYVIKDYLSNYA